MSQNLLISKLTQKIPFLPCDKLHKSLETVLNQQIYYSEVSNEVVELQKDANYYFNCLKKKGFIKVIF